MSDAVNTEIVADDDFDDFDDEPEVVVDTAPNTAPKRSGNAIKRFMEGRGWRTDYPKWAWWTAGGVGALMLLGVIGALAGGDEAPAQQQVVHQAQLMPAATTPTTAAPMVADPFVGMPPKHPVLDFILAGQSEKAMLMANQVRTARDGAGDLADPCRIWWGVVTNPTNGEKVVQLSQQDGYTPSFPVPVFVGSACARPEPAQMVVDLGLATTTTAKGA